MNETDDGGDFNGGDGNIHVAKFCAVAESPIRLFVSNVTVHVRPILSWMIKSLLEVIVPSRSNQAPCSIPLATFMDRFHQGDLEK